MPCPQCMRHPLSDTSDSDTSGSDADAGDSDSFPVDLELELAFTVNAASSYPESIGDTSEGEPPLAGNYRTASVVRTLFFCLCAIGMTRLTVSLSGRLSR